MKHGFLHLLDFQMIIYLIDFTVSFLTSTIDSLFFHYLPNLSLIHLSNQSDLYSFIYLVTPTLRSLFYYFVHSLFHSFNDIFIHLHNQSNLSNPSLISSFITSFFHSIIHLFIHAFTQSFTHLFTHFFFHFVISHSFSQPFLHFLDLFFFKTYIRNSL